MSNRTELIKKLKVKAHLRGTKENCELLGSFAKNHLSNLEKKDICDFEKLLDYTDPEITDWLLGYSSPPVHLANIIESIIKFYE